MDKAEATPARAVQIVWDEAANDELETYISKYSVLTRISAAKRLRDHAEALASREGSGRVTVETVRRTVVALDVVGGDQADAFTLFFLAGASTEPPRAATRALRRRACTTSGCRRATRSSRS